MTDNGGARVVVRRADERYRGGDIAAGIDTRHAFSFSGFYDPDNIRFGPLTACNEERIAPGGGYEEHRHRDLDIVTWVVEGELTHRDSTGRTTVVRPGDVQRLSTGAGARHVERNDGPAPLRFLQMWLLPREPGGEPEYEVVRGIADATRYALPRTDAVLHVRRPRVGEDVPVPDAPLVHLQVVRGRARLGEWTLAAGDEARISAPGDDLVVTAVAEGGGDAGDVPTRAGRAGGPGHVELLMWELGEPPGPG
ncbi:MULTISPECIES: pirin family protein [unclassified Streptomyces]|uniref:pirin family protein n=1 Tax=unclassified Streptomyces TaxID=2593676 RepID=UPI000CD49E84|nr:MULTISPECIES: pirin family protein [unclassified Streptomyces]